MLTLIDLNDFQNISEFRYATYAFINHETNDSYQISNLSDKMYQAFVTIAQILIDNQNIPITSVRNQDEYQNMPLQHNNQYIIFIEDSHDLMLLNY